ncbi:MAG: hypothetical protein FWE58_02360 [Methanobrevibacter sp.]|nr:hypothetical protein [Methanobrevibacter sp.]
MDNYLEKRKKEILKLLGIIGIDTRFISYTSNTIYINDQRFSKFSKKRQETFKKYYPEFEVISSTIFQKICASVSKVLSEELHPKYNVLLFKEKNQVDCLLKIVLEPYTRKYGIKIIESDLEYFDYNENNDENNDNNCEYNKTAIDSVLISLTLDEEVKSILSNVFSGNGIKTDKEKTYKKIKIIYPFINISNDWINSFLNTKSIKTKEEFNSYNLNLNNDLNNKKSEISGNNINNGNNGNSESKEKNKDSDIIAESFMGFLEEIIPQYKENILKSSIFLESHINKNNKL